MSAYFFIVYFGFWLCQVSGCSVFQTLYLWKVLKRIVDVKLTVITGFSFSSESTDLKKPSHRLGERDINRTWSCGMPIFGERRVGKEVPLGTVKTCYQRPWLSGSGV